MRRLRPVWAILWLGVLLLSACRSATPSDATPTTDPQAVMTAAAQTAETRATQTAAAKPTQAPADTPTQQPTVTESTPLTPTLTVTPTVEISGEDKLEFVADVTVPDGTIFKPGDTFVKTWKLKNSGTSTWGSGHSLVFVSGEQMGAPALAASCCNRTARRDNGCLGQPDRACQRGQLFRLLCPPRAGREHLRHWRQRRRALLRADSSFPETAGVRRCLLGTLAIPLPMYLSWWIMPRSLIPARTPFTLPPALCSISLLRSATSCKLRPALS